MTALARHGSNALGVLLCVYLGALVVQRYATLPISVGYGSWEWGNTVPVQNSSVTRPEPVLDTSGDLSQLQHAPTISAAQIDAVLQRYGSPAAGTGKDFYELGEQYGINPAIGLAFFVHESSAATNRDWAGWKADGDSTHNVGNIICAGYAPCYGRFRSYGSWRDGIADWYRLIRREYISEGRTTVATVIPKYAPATENDVQAYIAAVNSLVQQWAAQPVAGGKANVTRSMHISTGFDATGQVWCDVRQLYCQHYGIDYDGQPGDPVFAPYAMDVYAVGCYPPGPTEGCYVQGTLGGGNVLYLGHLADLPPFSAGQRIAAGQQVGEMSHLNHVHVQLGPVGVYGACASDGSCLNFDSYWREH